MEARRCYSQYWSWGRRKKKMVGTFGDAYATARVEGVFMGRGSGHKYRVKWTNLSEELISEYGFNHGVFQDPSKERPQKVAKIHGPQRISLDPARSSPAVLNTADILELHPSSGEDSEPEDAVPQIPAISPLQIGDNLWRVDPVLDLQDPRFGLPFANHRPQIRFPQHIPHGIDPTELECFELFMDEQLISHLLFHSNAHIVHQKDHITTSEMKKFIGIMLAMTLCPIANIDNLWKDEDDGFIPALRFGAKTGLSKGRFKAIRYHFATGPVGAGSKTFDAFRPIQDCFNNRVAHVFSPGLQVVVDESTSAWHGKDEKRADGPPALTHMKGKPEPVSFMFKTMCCVETGIMIAIELQEGKEVMARRQYSSDGEKSTTSVTLRLTGWLRNAGHIVIGDCWFASLNTLRKLFANGHNFIGHIKTGHSGTPLNHIRSLFNAQSVRGATATLHLGDGNARIFVHAWNEPGWKGGKQPKKQAKVFISNVYSAASVEPWRKERTCLLPDGTIEQRYLDVPQSQIIREYYRAANRVDIHNQYRQGILAIEKTWQTRNWNLRLFQTVLGKIIVNALFAFRYITGKQPTLHDFTNVIAQALCDDDDEESDAEESGRTRAERNARSMPSAVGPPKDRISHALVKGASLGLGNKRKQGPCSICKNKHATGVCVTCSKNLHREDHEIFWLCSTGMHGRQCYCQHLHEMLRGPR